MAGRRAPDYLVFSLALAKRFLNDLGEFLLAVGTSVLNSRPFCDALDAEDVCAAVYKGLASHYLVRANVAGEVSRLVHVAKIKYLTLRA